MPELLLEVGTEELPASFVRKAYTDLKNNITRLLEEAGVLDSEGLAMGTPRRMIVSFPNLKERQEDQVKEQRGPGVKAAYDAEGNPTQALIGFCRSQGIEPEQLRNDGQYVWVTKTIPGSSTAELLKEILPKAIRALTFDKTMRWGAGRTRFARPVRWILATWGGEHIPFQFEGVASGVTSRGHRFYAPDEFHATSLAALVQGLREHRVEPDPDVRRQRIMEGAIAVADGEPDLSEALIEENVFLTEWPTAIAGNFKAEYEDLPEPVLITAMAKHEKMFPVRSSSGKLENRFVFIRNSGEDDSVRKGSEWVLNARFNDAKFFFDEDRRHSLDDFLEKTSGILFQDKLGSVRQRADRLASLAAEVAEKTGASSEEVEHARLAGLYAKADLSTGLVSELASLQGVIGGEYARREGRPLPVVDAIAGQYDLGRIGRIDTESSRTAVRLIMADQLDKLAGYLGLGMAPSGSSDPFGLRRACTLLIEAAWLWPEPLPPYDELLASAMRRYEDQGVNLDEAAALNAFWEAMAARYEAILPEVRYDMMDAALRSRTGANVSAPRLVRLRLEVLEKAVVDTLFVQTATRPLNIVAAARKKGIEVGETLASVDRSMLQSEDGLSLLEAVQAVQPVLEDADRQENADEMVRLLFALADPINRFFDSTMVMADDEAVRKARLTLLECVSSQLLVGGDWSKIVIEG